MYNKVMNFPRMCEIIIYIIVIEILMLNNFFLRYNLSFQRDSVLWILCITYKYSKKKVFINLIFLIQQVIFWVMM